MQPLINVSHLESSIIRYLCIKPLYIKTLVLKHMYDITLASGGLHMPTPPPFDKPWKRPGSVPDFLTMHSF